MYAFVSLQLDAINGNQMTYNQLISNSNKLASFLDKRGYNQGDCLGIHVTQLHRVPNGYIRSPCKRNDIYNG